MPKKRQSQPVQVWLPDFDRLRLAHAAKKSGRSQSAIVREAIQRTLEELEAAFAAKEKQERIFKGLSVDARAVVTLALDEATSFGRQIAGTEHLLLALAADTKHSASRLLSKFGMSYEIVRHQVERLAPHGSQEKILHLPYTERCVLVLDKARVIAKHLRDRRTDVDHLLLSIIEAEYGRAYELLDFFSVDREMLRTAVRKDRSERKESRATK
jgi:ATP-dependent Clp protease ATP-binding subunit ClpA